MKIVNNEPRKCMTKENEVNHAFKLSFNLIVDIEAQHELTPKMFVSQAMDRDIIFYLF